MSIPLLTNSTALSQATLTEDQENFISLSIQHFQTIVQDTFERLEEYQSTPSKQVLTKGAWYAHDYYQALKKGCQHDRIKWMIERHCFFSGYAPTKYFLRQEDQKSPSGYKMIAYQIKPDINPSEALDHLANDLIFLDCGVSYFLANSIALKVLLTPKKFDHLFASNGPYPFSLAFSPAGSVHRLFDEVLITSEKDIQPGDLCFFASTVRYLNKHPYGHNQGLNTVCIDAIAQRYLAFGLSPEGCFREDIEKSLFDAYNSEPMDRQLFATPIWEDHAKRSNLSLAKLEIKWESLKDHQITWQQFQAKSGLQQIQELMSGTSEYEGKLRLKVARPNLQRIQQLIDAPQKKIRNVYKSFQN